MTVLGFEPGTGLSVATKPTLLPAAIPEPIEPDALIASVKWLVTAIVTVADFDGSAKLVATSATVGGDGKIWGAVKSPAEVTVPHPTPEQPGPSVFQLTDVMGFPAEVTPA